MFLLQLFEDPDLKENLLFMFQNTNFQNQCIFGIFLMSQGSKFGFNNS